MKTQFYGDIANKAIIRSAINNIYDINAGLLDSDVKLETITTNPNPLGTFGTADSDFGFTNTIQMTGDSS